MHQAADALLWLSTTNEDRTPIDDALPVVLFGSSAKEIRKVYTGGPYVIHDYIDNFFNFTLAELAIFFSLVSPKPGTITTPPTLD